MGKYRVRRDRILFVDLELTCWEGGPPAGESPEIIEVGLAEVDVDRLEVVRTGSYLVKPTFSMVSEYCEALTGISAARLKREGRPFAEVCSGLKKNWGTASKAWMSWGSDKRAVEDDCMRKGVVNPFSEAFHDIGMQFTLMSGRSSAVGLAEAGSLLGLEPEGRQHSGEDDAAQAARTWAMLARMLRASIAPSPEKVQALPGAAR